MVKFVKYFGGNETTVYGLAGLGDLYVSAIGGRNSQMGKHLGQGILYKDAKEKFMKNVTVEGAQLALEIGPILLKEFKKVTNCPVLVNTSFNVRGEPIVNTPEDAYRCFMRTEMDYLAIGGFLLNKTDQPEWESDDWQDEFELD